MKPENFPKLWKKRSEYDALFGKRHGRVQNGGRKFISQVSRFTVKMLFGNGVTDVNTPYRLMRSEMLKKIIQKIPEDTFAPNVIISGAISKAHKRIFEMDVPHDPRRTGEVSIVKWKLWKSVMKSFFQTLLCRPKVD